MLEPSELCHAGSTLVRGGASVRTKTISTTTGALLGSKCQHSEMPAHYFLTQYHDIAFPAARSQVERLCHAGSTLVRGGASVRLRQSVCTTGALLCMVASEQMHALNFLILRFRPQACQSAGVEYATGAPIGSRSAVGVL